jgi:hypothetical protein
MTATLTIGDIRCARHPAQFGQKLPVPAGSRLSGKLPFAAAAVGRSGTSNADIARPDHSTVTRRNFRGGTCCKLLRLSAHSN